MSVVVSAIVLLATGALLRSQQGAWLAPGPLFAAYWAFCILMPSVLAPGYKTDSSAVLFILCLCLSVCLGSWLAGPRRSIRSPERGPVEFNATPLRWLVVAGSAAGVLATVVIQSANGYSAASILSPATLINAAAAFSVDRYGGALITPAIVPLCLAFAYAAALVSPIAARGLSRGGQIAFLAGPVFGVSLYAILTTARAGLLTAVFFTFAGWLASRMLADGITPPLRFRSVVISAAVATATGLAFVAIAFLRIGSFAETYRDVIAQKLLIYIAGYLPAFSRWFADESTIGPSGWGADTFAGALFLQNGAGVRSAGFTEAVTLGDGTATSNIFTAWRYLITDYGVAFSPLVALVVGYVGTRAWRRLIQRPAPWSTVGTMAFYVYVLQSNTQTAFLFTNVVLAFVIAFIAVRGSWPTISTPATATPADGGPAINPERSGSSTDVVDTKGEGAAIVRLPSRR